MNAQPVYAQQLEASQMVPVLMTILLQARDIATRPLGRYQGVAEFFHDSAQIAVNLNQQWSSDEQRAARESAESILAGLTLRLTAPPIVTGLGGKVIGSIGIHPVDVEPANHCLWCNEVIEDATRLDYCSAQHEAFAMGEGA